MPASKVFLLFEFIDDSRNTSSGELFVTEEAGQDASGVVPIHDVIVDVAELVDYTELYLEFHRLSCVHSDLIKQLALPESCLVAELVSFSQQSSVKVVPCLSLRRLCRTCGKSA